MREYAITILENRIAACSPQLLWIERANRALLYGQAFIALHSFLYGDTVKPKRLLHSLLHYVFVAGFSTLTHFSMNTLQHFD